MDEGVQGQYLEFFRTNAGKDLIDRLRSTEANFMMQGMKSSTIEGKGIAMAKMEATYAIRTMLDDLAKPPAPKAAKPSGTSSKP